MTLFKSNWGKWADLVMGQVGEHQVLVQARRHKDGRVEFRIANARGAWGCEKIHIGQLTNCVNAPQ